MRNSTALILLMISAGLILSFVLPYYDKVMALRARSSEYNQILDNLANIGQMRDDLKVKYDNINSLEVAKLEKVLPPTSNTVSLATDFDSIAARYGISIKSINSLDPSMQSADGIVQATPSGPYSEALVTLSFIARYENFRAFMSDIEQSLRIIDVNAVSFQATDDGLYEFKVSVKTYWVKQ